MAKWYDIDTDVRINGNLVLPSGSLTIGTTDVINAINGKVSNILTISTTATSGLTGGGDLTANRSLAVDFAGTGTATTVSRSDHNHDTSYDKYGSWKLSANTEANPVSITSAATVDFVAGSNVTLSRNANTITINSSYTDTNTWRPIDDTPANGNTTTSVSSNWAYNHNAGTGNGKHVPSAGTSGQFLAYNGAWATPPDTNTWRPIDTTPTSGNTTTSISSDWAYTHKNATGLGAHVPTGGTATTFLRGDATWVTPTDTNTYLTSVAGSGNGSVTFTMNDTTTKTWDSSHTHSNYLTTTGTAADSSKLGGIAASSYLRNDQTGTISGSLIIDGGAGVLSLKPGATNDHVYIQLYADSQANTTRSGYFGYGSSGTSTMTIANEMTNGSVNITTNGSGVVQVNANTIWHAGNLTPIKSTAANQTVGTGFTVTGVLNINNPDANSGGKLSMKDKSSNEVITLSADITGAYNDASSSKIVFGGDGSARFSDTVKAKQLTVTAADGSVPMVVTSKTMVSNLNVEYLGGTKYDQYNTKIVTADNFGYGVLTGVNAIAQNPPTMAINVTAGTVYLYDGTRKTFSGGENITLSVNGSSSPRIDILYVNNVGNLAVAQGTAAASPVEPSIPSDGIKIARVDLQANASSITDGTTNGSLDMITDARKWRDLRYYVGSGMELDGYVKASSDIYEKGIKLESKYAQLNANNNFTGNIGINESAPNTKLHINNGQTSATTVYELTLQSGTDVGSARHGIEFRGGDTNVEARIKSGNFGSYYGGLIFETQTSSTASTSTVEAMRIHTNGYIGINNTAPAERLDVTGNIKASGSISAGTLSVTSTSSFTGATTFSGDITFNGATFNWKPATNFYMTPTANGQEWSFDFRSVGTYTGNYWQIWTDYNSIGTILAVTSDTARVGIRTSAPQRMLHVKGDARFETTLEVGTGTAANDFNVTSGGTLNFRNNLYSDGTKVGIGKTNPAEVLDVTGNIATSGYVSVNGTTFTKQADGSVRVSNTNGYVDIAPKNNGYAHIYTDRPAFYFNQKAYINGNLILTTADEGSGKGIDADTVDGKHSSDLMSSTVYREKVIIPSGGYAALTAITIPNSRVYVLGSNRLQVFRDGILQELTDDYLEATTSTITFQYALPADTKITFIINNAG